MDKTKKEVEEANERPVSQEVEDKEKPMPEKEREYEQRRKKKKRKHEDMPMPEAAAKMSPEKMRDASAGQAQRAAASTDLQRQVGNARVNRMLDEEAPAEVAPVDSGEGEKEYTKKKHDGED